MRDFHVFIEQQGEQIYVGKITGSGSEDALFSDVPDSFVINVGTGKDEEVLFATHRYIF